MKTNRHATHPKNVERILKAEKRTRSEISRGSQGMRDATVKMKKVTGGVSVLGMMADDGEVRRLASLQALEATDHTHETGRETVPLEIEKEAIVEIASGVSPREVAVKYDISSGYVAHALKRRFGSSEAAKIALQGFVMENALACMVHAAKEIPNMSGPQAVMSGAVLIDKGLALEKSISEAPKTIDFTVLAEMGKTLKILKEISESNSVQQS